MNERLKIIRQELELNQESFGKKIKLSRSHIASLESGVRTLTDRIIYDICREFSVSENWLRTGEGEMFVEDETFSLDEYAKHKGLTPLEIQIVKDFMDFNTQERKDLLNFFKKMFTKNDEEKPIHPQKEELIRKQHLEEEADEFAVVAREQFLAEKKRALKISSANESGVG